MHNISLTRLGRFLNSKTHDDVLNMIEEDIDLSNFKVTSGDTWQIYEPINPSSEKMPMICAHTDTARDIEKRSCYYDKDTKIVYAFHTDGKIEETPASKNKWAKQSFCLGADDRAGCYSLEVLMKERPNDFIFGFFDLEESGCIGSTDFATSKANQAEFKDKISVLLQIDRRGNKELALYGYESDEMKEAMKPVVDAGWKWTSGSMTDVATIASDFDICCINFSAGYYDEHTEQETLNIDHLKETIDMVLDNLPSEMWGTQFIPDVPKYKSSYQSKHTKSYDRIEFIDNETLEDVAISITSPNDRMNDLIKMIVTQSMECRGFEEVEQQLREMWY